jgi:hypothetical protein
VALGTNEQLRGTTRADLIMNMTIITLKNTSNSLSDGGCLKCAAKITCDSELYDKRTHDQLLKHLMQLT